MSSHIFLSPFSLSLFFFFVEFLYFLFQIAFISLFSNSYKHYYSNLLYVSDSQVYVCPPCPSYPCLVSVFPKLLLLLTLAQVPSFLLLSLWKISKCFPFCRSGFELGLSTDKSKPSLQLHCRFLLRNTFKLHPFLSISNGHRPCSCPDPYIVTTKKSFCFSTGRCQFCPPMSFLSC